MATRSSHPSGRPRRFFRTLRAAALFLFAAQIARAATFTVTETIDFGDGAINGVCDGNPFLAGAQCTLRAAIMEANGTAAADAIVFAINSATTPEISMLVPQPAIIFPLTIAGGTQPGFGEIVLNGASALAGSDCLVVQSAGVTITDLTIRSFPGDGIEIAAPATGCLVHSCLIGTGAGGIGIFGNGGAGIFINNSSGNTIGSTAVGQSNLFAGNGSGILIQGAGSVSNVLVGNYIGVNPGGFDRGNLGDGIRIEGGSYTRIGGPGAGEGNTIAGNGGDGISIGSGPVQATFSSTDTPFPIPDDGPAVGSQIEVSIPGTVTDVNVRVNITHTADEDIHLFFASSNYGNALASSNGGAGNNFINTVFDDQAATHISDGSAPFTGPYRPFVSMFGHLGRPAAQTWGLGVTDDRAGETGTMNSWDVILTVDSGPSFANLIQGNKIGTDSTGTLDRGNDGSGIYMAAAEECRIGGSAPGEGNVISGNGLSGIELDGDAVNNITILGNRIGTDFAGAFAIGNATSGIQTPPSGTVRIGGTAPGEANLISGNGFAGIYVSPTVASHDFTIHGNRIGTDAAGGAAIPNATGVIIQNILNVTIGGAGAGEGNLISGNAGDGVQIKTTFPPASAGLFAKLEGNTIGLGAAGAAALPNGGNGVFIEGAGQNVIGGPAPGAGNLISGNGTYGVTIRGEGAMANRIEGNKIGTDASGLIDLGNALDGVIIVEAAENVVGGGTSGAGNVISGNGGNGVRVSEVSIPGPGTQILGNIIGLGADGSTVIGNTLRGIDVSASDDGAIGGRMPGERNVISGNGFTGILLHDSAEGWTISGNYVGSDAEGLLDRGNGFLGIDLENAGNNTVGGVLGGEGNIVIGNADSGIRLFDEFADGNRIYGNRIGVNRAGEAVGNGIAGIHVRRAPNNEIGGADEAARNLISGNAGEGILLDGGDATGNSIRGNWIGTSIDPAEPLGNAGAGIAFIDQPTDNIIGGAADEANIIAFNSADGIYLFEGERNAFLANSIHSNGGLGIDLEPDGATGNDLAAADPDEGANLLQNFPELTAAASAEGVTTISLTLVSVASTEYRIDFYSNAACDPSGHGEGETYLGLAHVMTDGGGLAGGTAILPVTVYDGRLITATATDPVGNTSEFSLCLAASGPPEPINARVGEWHLYP